MGRKVTDGGVRGCSDPPPPPAPSRDPSAGASSPAPDPRSSPSQDAGAGAAASDPGLKVPGSRSQAPRTTSRRWASQGGPAWGHPGPSSAGKRIAGCLDSFSCVPSVS